MKIANCLTYVSMKILNYMYFLTGSICKFLQTLVDTYIYLHKHTHILSFIYPLIHHKTLNVSGSIDEEWSVRTFRIIAKWRVKEAEAITCISWKSATLGVYTKLKRDTLHSIVFTKRQVLFIYLFIFCGTTCFLNCLLMVVYCTFWANDEYM